MKAVVLSILILAVWGISIPNVNAQAGYSYHGQGNLSASMHGYGAWGGSQPCPYPQNYYTGTADEAKLHKKSAAYAKEESKLNAIQDRIETIAEKLKDEQQQDEVYDFIEDYYTNKDKYKGRENCKYTASGNNAATGTPAIQVSDVEGNEDVGVCTNTSDVFCLNCHKFINTKKGSIEGICNDTDFIAKEGRRSVVKSSSCNSLIKRLENLLEKERKSQDKLDKLYDEIDELEYNIEFPDDKIDRKNGEYETEAGEHCISGNCPTKTSKFISNFALPILAGYAVHRGVKSITKQNEALGYQTPPIAGALGGMVALNGIYGASHSGMGRGAYGCSGFSGQNMLGTILGSGALGAGVQFQGAGGGVFGYPGGMYNSPFGGGLFNQGTLPGGGFPGYNNGFNIGIGGQFGLGQGGFGGPFGGGGFGVGGQIGIGGVGGPFGGGGFGGPFGGGGFGAGGQIGIGGVGGPFGGGGFGGSFGSGGQFGSPFGGQFGGGGFGGGCTCIVAPCSCPTGGFGGQGGFGAGGQFGGFNSQAYQMQLQMYQQQAQLQLQIQQEQAAKAAQTQELNQKIQELYSQLYQINYGGTAGAGFSAGFNFNAGASIGTGVLQQPTGLPTGQPSTGAVPSQR